MWLTRTVAVSFSSLQYTSVRPELDYASDAWNSFASTDASKPERVQRISCLSVIAVFFQSLRIHLRPCIKLHESLHFKYSEASFRHPCVNLMFTVVQKFAPPIYVTVGLRVPDRNVGDFNLFHVEFKLQLSFS